MSGSESSPLAWVAIDFLCCLLLVVLHADRASAPADEHRDARRVRDRGHLAGNRDDDVDTYVEDPEGNIVSFSNRDVALMHLDHDDLGRRSDRERYGSRVAVVKANEERVVLRGVVPGEVTVNVHAYRMSFAGPCPVHIRLYRLRGEDRKLLDRSLTLSHTGEEATAFRFALDAYGRLLGHNTLSRSLVAQTGLTA